MNFKLGPIGQGLIHTTTIKGRPPCRWLIGHYTWRSIFKEKLSTRQELCQVLPATPIFKRRANNIDGIYIGYYKKPSYPSFHFRFFPFLFELKTGLTVVVGCLACASSSSTYPTADMLSNCSASSIAEASC